jgi:predicted oxidoreductase
MNKTTLSPIIAGTMNWEFGIKPNIEGNAKHDSCLLRKQNTTFDHADIYGSPLKVLSAKHLLVNSREKIQLISKCGIQMLAENRDNKIKHYDYSKSHIIWSVEQSLKNLKTD